MVDGPWMLISNHFSSAPLTGDRDDLLEFWYPFFVGIVFVISSDWTGSFLNSDEISLSPTIQVPSLPCCLGSLLCVTEV